MKGEECYDGVRDREREAVRGKRRGGSPVLGPWGGKKKAKYTVIVKKKPEIAVG